MKVLIIGTDGNKSGASLSMVVLAQKARNEGIDICIVIPARGSLEEKLIDAKIEYYVVPSYNWIEKKNVQVTLKYRIKKLIKKGVNARAEIKISRIIDDFNPDIVHLNTICSGVGAKSALKKNKALIWHIREFVEEDHGYVFWNKCHTYELMKKADLLIAISKCVYNKFAFLVDKNRIQMIYNGIDVDRFYYEKNHAFDETGMSTKPIQIYMGGSIAESKGQYLLLEAANYLRESGNIHFEIHILGKGDDEYIYNLKKYIKNKKLETCIYFEGFQDNMHIEWRKADIAVVASKAEAFGRVTVEAMLAGALLIGADSGGTVEIIEDKKTGLLFESGNSKSLADRIRWADENKKEARQLAIRGQHEVKNKFTADRNAKEVIAAYQAIYSKLGRANEY